MVIIRAAVFAGCFIGVSVGAFAADPSAKKMTSKQVCLAATDFRELNYRALGEKIRSDARAAILCEALLTQDPAACASVDPIDSQSGNSRSLCLEQYNGLMLSISAMTNDPAYLGVCRTVLGRMREIKPGAVDGACASFQATALRKLSAASFCRELENFVTVNARQESFIRECPTLFHYQRGAKKCSELEQAPARALCIELSRLDAAITAHSVAPCGQSLICRALFTKDTKLCEKRKADVVAQYCAAKENKAGSPDASAGE